MLTSPLGSVFMSLKKDLFSALKLSGLLHTGPKLELNDGTLLAHVNAPLSPIRPPVA